MPTRQKETDSILTCGRQSQSIFQVFQQANVDVFVWFYVTVTDCLALLIGGKKCVFIKISDRAFKGSEICHLFFKRILGV